MEGLVSKHHETSIAEFFLPIEASQSAGFLRASAKASEGNKATSNNKFFMV